ncbi:DUF397 domain-containing protein [Streptomyces purpurogeneiscleroticus]|uniref:DUF397 domain-containing protein n=1 Tax=Streptomyces purpurogeneiscleroticus TaxID=68259 RepID=UPI001CBCE9C3|nr:DUF397 domain-containing protein [Streptomyces purpurogeneiscleroticus]MBZ4020324.1 DUF397 domain-containing protein [Streptomyces purpurogeneiscleroticus]
MSDLKWFKSSYSDSTGGQCVEVAPTPATIHIRDSKDPDGPILDVRPDVFAAFITFAARA